MNHTIDRELLVTLTNTDKDAIRRILKKVRGVKSDLRATVDNCFSSDVYSEATEISDALFELLMASHRMEELVWEDKERARAEAKFKAIMG